MLTLRSHRSHPTAFVRPLLLICLLGGLLIAGGAGVLLKRGFSGTDEQNVLTEQVARKDFFLTITESGEVESSGAVELRCEVKSNNTAGTSVLRVVKEGTRAVKGDVLVELDSSALKNDRLQQQILVNTSEALMIQARNVFETAEIALQEYLQGTFKQEKEILESEVFIAEENLRRAKEYLQYSRLLAAKGYVTNLQLEADQFAVEKSEKELAAARTKLEVLEQFTKAKMTKQLESDIATAEAKWEAERSSHALEASKLKDIEDQIAKCTLRAPADGQVTYANRRGWRGDDDFVLEEGSVVRQNQVLIRLPDPKQMQVEVEINESIIDQIEEGMLASIRPVGRDDVVLPATVVRVNEYSEPTSRWEGNIKNYVTIIRIDRSHPALRVGMTAEVTIHCRQLPGVLQVPVQAVYAHGRELTYCFVRTNKGWQEREVVVGPTNGSFVVIEKGLDENELVSLKPRSHLEDVTLPQLAADKLQTAVRLGPQLADAGARNEPLDPKPEPPPDSDAMAGLLMQQFDKNDDGMLELSEMPDAMQSNFKTADADGNNKLDHTELASLTRRFASPAADPASPAPSSGAAQ